MIRQARNLTTRAIYDTALDQRRAVQAIQTDLSRNVWPASAFKYTLGDGFESDGDPTVKAVPPGTSWGSVFQTITANVAGKLAGGVANRIGGNQTKTVYTGPTASDMPTWQKVGLGVAGAGALFLLLKRR